MKHSLAVVSDKFELEPGAENRAASILARATNMPPNHSPSAGLPGIKVKNDIGSQKRPGKQALPSLSARLVSFSFSSSDA